MTAEPVTELAPVPDDDGPLIESEPDVETFPFRVAYRRRGERIVEKFLARVSPPFAVYRCFGDLDRAGNADPSVPAELNACVRRLIETALIPEAAERLLGLIEGDSDKVGVITPAAIGDVVDVLRRRYYNMVPTPPSSSSGRTRAGTGSKAKRSAKASTSKPRRSTTR